MWGRRSVNPSPKKLEQLTFERKPRRKKATNQKSKMFNTGYREFCERTNIRNEGNNSNSPGGEDENCNPFFHCPRVEEEPQCEVTQIDDDDDQEKLQ